MKNRKLRIGHHLIASGVFIWLALSVAVSFTAHSRVFAVAVGDVFSLSNSQRVANGLPALTSNSKLNSSAQNKAQDMLNDNYFAHDAPDGTTPWSFIAAAGYSYSAAAENLAASNQGANSIVQGWMDSPGHRANLLSSTYSEVGYGVVFVGDWTYNSVTYNNTYFVVAHYGLPSGGSAPAANPEPEPEPAPTSTQQQTTTNVASETTQAEPDEAEVEAQPEEDADDTIEQEYETTPLTGATGGSGGSPTTAVSESQGALVSPAISALIASLALSAIVVGVVLEVRWLRRHIYFGSHHLPHLHA